MQHTKGTLTHQGRTVILTMLLVLSLCLCMAFPVGARTAHATTTSGQLKFTQSLITGIGNQVKNGACLCYCYSYTWAVVFGKTYSPSKFNLGTNGEWYAKGMSGDGSGEFTYKTYTGTQSMLKKVYDSVTSGHPTVIYVKTKTGGQHWVVIVGVTKVTDTSKLSLSNFLMLDPADSISSKGPKPITVSSMGYSLKLDASNNVRICNNTVSFVKGDGTVTTTVDATPQLTGFAKFGTVYRGKDVTLSGEISSSAKITSISAAIYRGSTLVKRVTLKPNDDSVSLQESVDGKSLDGSFNFGNLSVGKYALWIKATVGGKDYVVLKKMTFKVNPATSAISGVSSIKQTSAKVTWKKVKQTKGYYLRYSTNADFSGAKTLFVKGGSKTSATLKKLKAGTTYYVQVRTFAKKSGTKYYGLRSAVKTFTTAADPKATVTMKLANATYPTQVAGGQGFDFKGTITSNYAITKVEATLLAVGNNRTTVVGSATAAPNATSFSLYNSAIDNGLSVGQLDAGTYRYQLKATSNGKTKTLLDKEFTIVA